MEHIALKIAIVEDEEYYSVSLTEYLKKYGQSHGILFSVRCFPCADVFLSDYKSEYDIVFMDIVMPGTNGLAAAKKLREADKSVILIFITNLAKFAVKGYEVDALDFIVKPISYEHFAMKLDKAVEVADRYIDEKIVVKDGGKIRIFKASEIKYIEVIRHELIFYTVNGRVVTRGTLSAFEKKLSALKFERCGVSYLVNLRYVTGVSGNTLYIGDNEVPIGRTKKASFMAALSNYLGRNI